MYAALELGGYTSTSEDVHFSIEVANAQDCLMSYDENESEVYLKLVCDSEKLQKLLPDLSKSKKQMYTLLPKTLLLQYLDLCDSITDLLQALSPKEIIKTVANFVVSDVPDQQFKLFSENYIKSLKKSTSTTMILRRLFPYSNWYDFSFIEELIKEFNCSEGVDLLEWFYSRINKTLPMSYYPLPTPSALMIPDKSSSHFLLVMRYTEKPFIFSHVIVLKLFLLRIFKIKSYACILLAVVNPDILYWLLPISVLTIVRKKILEHFDYFYTKGIIDIAISPDIIFSKSGMLSIQSLPYFTFEDKKVSILY